MEITSRQISQSSASHHQSQHPLQRLLRYGRAYRRQIWLASACSVLNKIFDLAPPVLIGMAVDVVVQQNNSLLATVLG